MSSKNRFKKNIWFDLNEQKIEFYLMQCDLSDFGILMACLGQLNKIKIHNKDSLNRFFISGED